MTSGARLDWSRNRYLNAVFDYSRTLGLGKLLDPLADFRVFFGSECTSGDPVIFADGFESGDISAWSGSNPP